MCNKLINAKSSPGVNARAKEKGDTLAEWRFGQLVAEFARIQTVVIAIDLLLDFCKTRFQPPLSLWEKGRG